MAVKPDVAAFAVGFAAFLAFAGSAVVAPPDPVTQLLVLPVLLVAFVPVVYRVLDADRVGEHDRRSRAPFPYFVAVTVASTAAALAVPVPVPGDGGSALLLRGGAFLAAGLGVSLAAVRLRGDGAQGADAPGE